MIWVVCLFLLSLLLIITIFKNKILLNSEYTIEIPPILNKIMIVAILILVSCGTYNNVFFYAEPGFIYHVRTITGQERVIDGVGYFMHLFGRVNAWKKAMTVLADVSTKDGINAEEETAEASVSIRPFNIMFLDQVDADASAMTRYRIPTDEETFLKMAHEYRTPNNLLNVALVPAFQETLKATGQLMSAEDYYSGGSTEFMNEFEGQMQNGIYLVKREEIRKPLLKQQTKDADASKNGKQDEFGDNNKTVFVVTKQLGSDGLPLRKKQKFTTYGITVHEARITDMVPNSKFIERMQLKQKASADRAIAREQKIQEEEQRLLAIARGDREVAERQASMKVEQIQVTTTAETAKKKALINASRLKEEAIIQEETAKILLSKSKIDAEAIRVASDVEAYSKKKILEADNALAQKLETELKIQEAWAKAYAQRAVPHTVLGSSGDTPTGKDTEVKDFMKLLTIDAAQRLNYNREINTK